MTTLEHEARDHEDPRAGQDTEPEAEPDGPDEQDHSVSLFEGDEGGLDLAERRALVILLKQRFISARTHPRAWRALVDNERVIRSRLHDLFLDLEVDPVREVAWKRQAVSETGDRFPTLLHDVAWSREETVVLVYLRDRYRVATSAGEDRVFVEREDIVDHVAGFRPAHATDVSGDEKRARNAVATINRSGLLIGSPHDHRLEISEAVESLLPLEKLRELLAGLERTNDPEAPAEDPLFAEDETATADEEAGR